MEPRSIVRKYKLNFESVHEIKREEKRKHRCSRRERNPVFSCQNNESLDRYKQTKFHRVSPCAYTMHTRCISSTYNTFESIENPLGETFVLPRLISTSILFVHFFPSLPLFFSNCLRFRLRVVTRRCSAKHPEKQDACALHNGERRLSPTKVFDEFSIVSNGAITFQLVLPTALIKRGSLG